MRALFAVASAAAFLLETFVAMPYSHVLQGAHVYSPGLMVALVLGVFQATQQMIARFTLLAAAGVYLAALFLPTIDNEVCSVLSIGTHFPWQILIGLLRTWQCAP